MLNGGSCTDNQATLEIGVLASLFGINAQQVQVLPDRLHQVIRVQIHLTTHHDSPGCTGQLVNLLDRNRVNLVVAICIINERGQWRVNIGCA